MFSIFLFFVFKSYDYKKTYIINKHKIIEKFDKSGKYYTFEIKNDNIKYRTNDYCVSRYTLSNTTS